MHKVIITIIIMDTFTIPSSLINREKYISIITPFIGKQIIKVVTMDAFSGNTYKGIEHIHIKDFLMS